MRETGMNRITRTFETLRQDGRKGLVGYLTAGDPDPAASEQRIRTAIGNGVDVLELGMPFSDATADGPTIQAASQRALAAGMTVGKLLEMVSNLRKDVDVPIVLFGYANPFFCYGFERLCRDAAEAGADGLLVVDLPFEERLELSAWTEQHSLCMIPLVAPTTSQERARSLLASSQGFVYYIAVTGVTGTRSGTASDISRHVEALRACTDLPVAVGFGIRNGADARRVAASADAVVVGSALLRAADENRLADLVRELRDALDADEQ